MMNENIVAKGVFSMQLISSVTGKVIEDYTENNLVVSLGRTNVAKLLGGDVAGLKISKIAVGTNGADPVLTDNALTDQFSKAITSVTYPESNTVQFNWELGEADANGLSIVEFGLLNDANVLFARKTRSAIVKTNLVRLVGSWKIFIN